VWKLQKAVSYSATGAFPGAHQGAFTMPKLSPELLSVLRCPVTGSHLVQEGEELVTVTADDSGNKLRYRIEDGIPLLLPPELLSAATGAPAVEGDAGEPDGAQHDGGPDAEGQEGTRQKGAGQEGTAPRHAAE